MSKRSKAWEYFEKKNKDEAECSKCANVIKCAGGSTTGLIVHLRTIHKIYVKKREYQPNKCQQTLDSFIAKKSIEEEISKLVCVDGFSFSSITKSEFIQDNLKKNKYDKPHPTSYTDVKNTVIRFYGRKKAELTDLFGRLVNQGVRFSITLDEYTSIQNKRYMDITVHQKDQHWSLGLVNITGRLHSDRAVEIVKMRLNDYGLNLDQHIIGSITDGASVMAKFGKDITSEHQQCVAHAIHLAVCDILYEKKESDYENEVHIKYEVEEDVSMSVQETDDEEELPENVINEAYIEGEEGTDNSNELIKLGIDCGIDIPRLDYKYHDVIEKVRKVCRIFRRSPIKNETLQVFVKDETKGKELRLILDCKIRWNRLLCMIERFLKLKTCIQKALIAIRSTESISSTEWDILENLFETLRPVEMILTGLCSQDASLLKAESSFKFILKHLGNKNNQIAFELKEALQKRFSYGRQKEIVGLLKYLHNPEVLKVEGEDPLFSLPSKLALTKTAERLFKRLFISQNITTTGIEIDWKEHESNEDPDDSKIVTEGSIQQDDPLLSEYIKEMKELEKIPKKKMSGSFNPNKEFRDFEESFQRSDNLEKLYQALLSIKPTCVESERAFSAAGLFLTRLRFNLDEESLNALWFLKGYFKSHKK